MDRRRMLGHGMRVAVGAAAAAAGLPALAQQGTTRVVVGFAAGGSVDGLARLVAESLQGAQGRPAIVENRTGAAGRLAVEQVKAAPPDGETLLIAPHGPMTLFPYVFRNLRYDPARDFVPITGVASGDYALTIGPKVPARDLAGLRAWLAGAGDKAAYGSPGAGTVPHFLGVAFARSAGVSMTHVPYRGSTLSMNDLAGGAIAAAVSPMTEALELHKAGRVTIVATFGARRSTFVEGVPTLRESGLDIDVPAWFALHAPAATPAATVERIRQTIHASLAAPANQERIARLGLVPSPSGTPELLAMQRRERELWEGVVKASGFTPED